jgi:uncharacterized protein YqjF (DUF2071 family)
MSLIRKTISIGTLGVVSFRSKKELLKRAEQSRREADLALEDEHRAREAAESRVAAAEKRARQAQAEAEHTAQRLARAKRRFRRDDLIRASGTEAVERGRKAGRRARKAAGKAAAKATLATKDVVVPAVEKVATKVRDSIED